MTGDLFQERASPPPDDRRPARPQPPVIPVSVLVSQARLLLERQLGLAWISGEISGFNRAASEHCYFNLKDAQAQVRCVLFRLRAQHVDFPLRDGLRVEVRATPTIYDAKGEFQLTVDSVRQAGMGALYERFARLKAKLEADGWFAASRKRALPRFPRAVGIVTSPRAAALRDVLTTLSRRWPALRIVLYPASVQGSEAAGDIARAIRIANARGEVDVLIVARGGGSIEDLWAFNEEPVARAVFDSKLPVISGVGHETDFTICDFVADVRAPTPTAAATLVVPDRQELRHRLDVLMRRHRRAIAHAQGSREQRLDHAMRRLVHPAARIKQQGARAGELARRLARCMQAGATTRSKELARARDGFRRLGRERLSRAAEKLSALAQNLAHLNPEAVLTRGYAIVAKQSGEIVADADALAAGDRIAVTFAHGGADATVDKVRS